MKGLKPEIRLTSNAVAFRFLLNDSPLSPLQTLELFEYANSKTDYLWAFRLMGSQAEIYRPPITTHITLTEDLLVYDKTAPERFFEWLPTPVVRSVASRATKIMVETENGEIPLNEILNRSVRV